MDDVQNNLLARLDERQKAMDGKIDAILIQTTKTNGRLTKVEEDVNNINYWRAKVKGYYSAIAVVLGALCAVLGWIFSK